MHISESLSPRPNGMRYYGGPRRLIQSDVAVAVVVLVLLSMGLITLVPWRQGASIAQVFTPEHVQMLGMVDNRVARFAYRAGLIMLAVLSLVSVVLTTRRGQFLASPFAQATVKVADQIRTCSGLLVIAAAAVVLLLNLQGTVFVGPEPRRVRLGILFISVCLTLCWLIWAKYLRTPAFAITAWVCIIAYAAFLILPGSIHSLVLSEPLLDGAEMHYSATLAQGDRLAAGLRLGSEIRLNYGLIPPTVLAVLERNIGFLDFAGHIRLVQASQAAFLAMAVIAFSLWKPRNPFFVLFATVLIGP